MSNEPIMAPEETAASEPMTSSMTTTDTTPNTETPTDTPSLVGIAIGLLIVLLTLVLVGLYLWSRSIATEPLVDTYAPQRPTAEENNEPESTTAEAQAEILQVVSTSDEVAAIEADLTAADLDNIDAELTAIEAEIDAALR